MALKLPPGLKLNQLKSLAFQCGVSTSGTKSILSDRLYHEVVPLSADNAGDFCAKGNESKASRTSTENKKCRRVLSIDMGIRNLAYSVLELPVTFPSSKAPSRPSLLSWHRTNVSSPTAVMPGAAAEKESFTPTTFSALAYNLLTKDLLLHNPTYVLIERQRFRSMGSKHILEWTIRVNMFESMIYAILHTLKSEGIWHGHVIPIIPGKVGGFWMPEKSQPESEAHMEAIDEEVEGTKKARKKRNTTNAKLLNKGAKIDLVRTWLDPIMPDGEGSECPLRLSTDQANEAAKSYLQRWHKAPGRQKKATTKAAEAGAEAVLVTKAKKLGAGPEKLDDLADCLLQGMAWIRWEENKAKVLHGGVEMIDLDMEPRSLRGG